MIKECCVCGRREREGVWSRDFSRDEQLRVSHGYCPACYEEFMDRLDQLFLGRGKKKCAVVATVQG
jgi:hypothetical protein